MKDESMHALQDARPPRAGTEGHEALHREIVSGAREMVAERAALRPARSTYRRWGIAGVATAAVTVAALASVFALTAPYPDGEKAAPSAYAAVSKAVARTAAVGDSGTLATTLRATWNDDRTGTLMLDSVVKWNGEDISLAMRSGMEGDSVGEMHDVSLYAEGKYYERDAEGDDWIHHADADNGKSDRVGEVWVAAARKDIEGERLRHILGVLKDLSTSAGKDGSRVYVGHATAAEIDANYRDSAGLPCTSRPFPKLGDPNASVKVQVQVGADGVIDSWTAAYSWDNADWVYRCDYRDLGSTPKIQAPDPDSVEESDGTWG